MMNNVLVAGVDVHRKTNSFCLMRSDGQEVTPRFTLANNRSGTQALLTKVRQVMDEHEFSELKVAAEATGWYWFHLFETLRQAAHPTELFLLNPRLTANFKKSYVDLDKSDHLDAFVIADRLRWGRDVQHPFQYDEKLLALRFLTRYRYHVVHQLAGEKAYCLSVLYLKASEYANEDRQPFSNLFGAASRAVIQEFASLEEVAAMPFNELVEWIDQRGRRHFANPEDNARRLQTVAQESYPLAETLQAPVNLVLNLSLKNIGQLESLQKHLDVAIAEQMEGIPNTLTTIPGFGPVLAAGIIAEIGGVERFNCDEAKVAKFAGFKWRKSGSAEFQAEETPMTRTGNPFLRYYFCEAAFSVQSQVSEFGDYYQRKFKEASKHKHKRAIVLTARKLVRLVVRLLTNNQPFQVRKL
jgi:transposase